MGGGIYAGAGAGGGAGRAKSAAIAEPDVSMTKAAPVRSTLFTAVILNWEWQLEDVGIREYRSQDCIRIATPTQNSIVTKRLTRTVPWLKK
jgi:hypothetical protein